ncbi:MAG: 6-phosphogluconolactonase [Candidatus Peregrinibacteria bacterium]
MKKFQIQSFSTKSQALQSAAETITHFLGEFSTVPILLLASGGSALEIFTKTQFPQNPKNITLSVLDERYNSDPTINNFAQLSALEFFTPFVQSGGKIIDTRPKEGETLEDLASRFDTALKNWKTENPNGKIFITQGMGLDGHTAGIIPFPENSEQFTTTFEDAEKWAVGYNAGEKNQYPLRVTTTLSFLRDAVDQSLVFITGATKIALLQKILEENKQLCNAPIGILNTMKQCIILESPL